ncbi:3-phosphoshikimate 1-carboxyvinyltransferase [Pullulanibacillus sp. KACC 23026]|uniref:3-phosphoshikimate 1-carboxyvinyltransferase n=1 Tax=Pullulanibacillus sp. KACC 23026 TaxID=3028315 RepID=UPI0023B1D467|nr:3-phosphoshikimate 1-carboxyvinyltransferase [Pullulanibacillus sp. KACC 23026]WEG11362.1 3-phosphoshikimate 1-carboxyvinyltransferase [Pullulanibacillus sp. KACC 23026]
MTDYVFDSKGKTFTGEMTVPGDKSISHRSVMLGSIAEGTTTVEGFLLGEDCLSTIRCMSELGVTIERDGEHVTIHGNGLKGLTEPKTVLDVGNSGTTARLIIGLLSGQPFYSVISGDRSLNKRPMDRVTKPLKNMGGTFYGRENGRYAPLSIVGGALKAIHYQSPVASAQVKSSLVLAGLQASGETTIEEPHLSRDHTERMLRAFGVTIETEGTTHRVKGGQTLTATHIRVPGDFSSAAFFIAAALITPGSELIIKNVGINPTRTGLLTVLENMGASIELLNQREENFEPVADLHIKGQSLKATTVSGEVIPRLIDEIPILALIASQAEGTTVIKDAEELRVKETDRIQTVCEELTKIGVQIEPTPDGMIIQGQPRTSLKGGRVKSHGDHRIGMMLGVAAVLTDQPLILEEGEAIAVSFPGFYDFFTKNK